MAERKVLLSGADGAAEAFRKALRAKRKEEAANQRVKELRCYARLLDDHARVEVERAERLRQTRKAAEYGRTSGTAAMPSPSKAQRAAQPKVHRKPAV